METLYRKTAVSERLPETEGIYHCIFSGGHIFTIPYLKEYSFHEEFTDCSEITHWLEEIPDHQHQLEKLEADKADWDGENEIENIKDTAHTEGILLGLKICKEMWAQGTISHENIYENEILYKEELENLSERFW